MKKNEQEKVAKDSLEIERLQLFRRQRLLVAYTFVANSCTLLERNIFYRNKVFKNIEPQNR